MCAFVSFVIPSLNEGDMLRETIMSLESYVVADHEIVVVDNGSTDGSADFINAAPESTRIRLFRTERPLGVAGARNFGAAFAQGDMVVFLDGHVLSYYDWVTPLLEVLSHEDVGIAVPVVSAIGEPDAKGYGMTWTNPAMEVEWLSQQSSAPYGIPLSAGMCVAFRWDFFHEIGGFDPGMVGYGHEDLEICLRTWLLGKSVSIVPNVEVAHNFRSSAPYKISWDHSNYNLLRTAYAHFSHERLRRVLKSVREFPGIDKALGRLNVSDIWSRRRMWEERQKHDDDWFCERFGVNV